MVGDRRVDVLVVGAGPAGLAASAALAPWSGEVLLLDRGGPLALRSEDDPGDLVSGQGGAGLYSDGKFSFHPSASRLWEVEPQGALAESYRWFADLLADVLPVPGYPEGRVSGPAAPPPVGARRKSYRSRYVPLEQRFELVGELSRAGGREILFDTEVVEVHPRRGGPVDLVVRRRGSTAVITARAVVLAGGRFGPLSARLDRRHLRFERVELGLRIEQPAPVFFLLDEPDLDPKYLIPDPVTGAQWRTFCCCRDGRVVPTAFGRWRSLSGRADCPPTGLSNVGFTMRVTDEARGRALLGLLATSVPGRSVPEGLPWERFMADDDGGAELLGGGEGAPWLLSAVRRGLITLSGLFGDTPLSGSVLHWPAVEGVGYYPRTDSGLRLPGFPLWVAGDASGKFRGITAALVSGHFSGQQALLRLREGSV
ncbi:MULTISPECIES: hypothetical protein [Actinosynnema]|uniref:hypothetical protein n=1 Tax=Actinosynnema TaxID=40566 RepID=UPI0020A35665|nr:hypothetical protein [Actinosynnema pretiosum]